MKLLGIFLALVFSVSALALVHAQSSNWIFLPIVTSHGGVESTVLPSVTAVPVPSVTVTHTPTPTSTPTPTVTVVAIGSPVNTIVASTTPTTALTSTPHLTSTPTQSATSLPTNTSTATETSTATPTQSPTPLPTGTATEIPTATPTFTPTNTSTPETGWSKPLLIAGGIIPNNNAHISTNGAMILDAEQNLQIAYTMYHLDNGASGQDNVFVKTNVADSGWSEPITISNVSAGISASSASIFLNQQQISYLIWMEGADAKFSIRSQNGDWQAPISIRSASNTQVLNNYVPVDNGVAPKIVGMPSGGIGVTWRGSDNSQQSFNIYWSNLVNGTMLWSDPQRLAIPNPPGPALVPTGVLDNSNVAHIMWATFSPVIQYWYTQRDATAISWQTPISVPLGGSARVLSMVADTEGVVHLLGQDTYGLLYATKHPDEDWMGFEVILSGEYIGNFQGLSSIAVDHMGRVHVAWIYGREIRYMQKLYGQTWSEPVTIFDSFDIGRDGSGPQVLTLLSDYDNELSIIWKKDGGIYYSTTNARYK